MKDEATKIVSDCEQAASFYEEKPGLAGALTDVDLYRAIARLARIVERLVKENDDLKAARPALTPGLEQPR